MSENLFNDPRIYMCVCVRVQQYLLLQVLYDNEILALFRYYLNLSFKATVAVGRILDE